MDAYFIKNDQAYLWFYHLSHKAMPDFKEVPIAWDGSWLEDVFDGFADALREEMNQTVGNVFLAIEGTVWTL